MALTGEKYKISFIAAGLMTGLSFYTYQNTWVLCPVIFLFICLVYLRQAIKRWQYLLLAIIIVLIVVYPIYYFYNVAPASDMESRGDLVTIFNKPRPLERFFIHFSVYFSPDFLFFKGDMSNMPGTNGAHGMFQVPLMVLLPPGRIFSLYHIITQSRFKREIILVTGFIPIYPLVAAGTHPAPHALRSYTLIPAFHILAGIGLWLVIILPHAMIRTGLPGIRIK